MLITFRSFSFFVSWIGFPFAYYGWREECRGNWAWCSEGFVMTILLLLYLGRNKVQDCIYKFL